MRVRTTGWSITLLALGAITLAACGDEQAADAPEDTGAEEAEEATEDTDADEGEAVDEAQETDEADATGAEDSLYSDALHDLQEIEVPEPGTAVASLAGEVTTFDIEDRCRASDRDEELGPDVDPDHDRPGEDDAFLARFLIEHDDGFEDRLSVEVTVMGDEVETERTEHTQVGFANDGELFTEGAGQVAVVGDAGLQAGEGDLPVVRVTEDLTFSAQGEFAPTPGSGEEMRVAFELAGACS